MNFEADADTVQSIVIRGAKAAYDLDNPIEFGRTFGMWLEQAHAVSEAHVISHVEELCRRAVTGQSRKSFTSLDPQDQSAVQVTLGALRGQGRLRALASLSSRLAELD